MSHCKGKFGGYYGNIIRYILNQSNMYINLGTDDCENSACIHSRLVLYFSDNKLYSRLKIHCQNNKTCSKLST